MAFGVVNKIMNPFAVAQRTEQLAGKATAMGIDVPDTTGMSAFEGRAAVRSAVESTDVGQAFIAERKASFGDRRLADFGKALIVGTAITGLGAAIKQGQSARSAGEFVPVLSEGAKNVAGFVPETFSGVGGEMGVLATVNPVVEKKGGFLQDIGKLLADFFSPGDIHKVAQGSDTGSRLQAFGAGTAIGGVGGFAAGTAFGGVGGAAITETGDTAEALIGLGGKIVEGGFDVLSEFVRGGFGLATAYVSRPQASVGAVPSSGGGMNASFIMLMR